MNAPSPEAITRGPLHHFFGYYNIVPFDASGRLHLCLELPFMDRPPTADDEAVIGMVDLDGGELVRLARTHAWNWQQGCMLHWLPTAPDREIIYNVRREDRFVSVVRDVHSGAERVAGRPVAAVSRSGRHGLSLNFARLAKHRPGYGYEGLPDPFADDPRPEDDGLWLVNLETGEGELVLSLSRACDFIDASDGTAWFNHVLFNTADTRFVVLLRYAPPGHARHVTSLLTANVDGSDLHCLARETLVSHYDWRDARDLLAFADGARGRAFYILRDGSDGVDYVNGLPHEDGHCSYSPDRR